MFRFAMFIPGLALLLGCTTTTAMETYVPARCHGLAEPFSTYQLKFVEVPGFIEGVIRTALEGALTGLDLMPATVDADVDIVNSFFLIDRNPPRQDRDPFGEPVESGSVNRFVSHLKVDVVDLRSGALLWTGAMYRPHAIQGGETFHNELAVLLIRAAFDEMFVGLTTPCE